MDDATAAEAPWQQLHLTALDEWRVRIPRPLKRVQAERLVGDAASPGITLVFMPGEESKPLVAHGCRNSFQSIDAPLPGLVVGRRVSRYGCPETHDGIRLVLHSNADTFELVSTRALKKQPEFDTFITEDKLAHIAQGVDEEVTLEIKEKLVEKKRVFKTPATPTTTTPGPSVSEPRRRANSASSAPTAGVKIEPAGYTRERAKQWLPKSTIPSLVGASSTQR